MSSIPEKIKEIEDEMARTQKNKATSTHLGLLKAKLSKLRRELISANSSKSSSQHEGFDVSKTGVARIGFIGFPSVGKSTLMNQLTNNTTSAVGDYEFTTLTTIPGVMYYNGAKIQILDLPGIIEGAKEGKGRGKQVLGVARTCSLLLIVLDITKPITHKKLIEKELEAFGLRLNKKKPNIKITKKDKGGIMVLGNLDKEMAKTILKEYRINNAEIFVSDNKHYTADDLIDVIEDNRKYVPALYVLNKIDRISIEELDILSRIPNSVPICAHKEWNIDKLLESMWNMMELIRIYPKPKGGNKIDEEPIVIKRDKNTVKHLCNIIHKSIIEKFKYALVWGSSVKHNPQKVGKDHELNDEDVVQIVKKI
ncbi:GTP-binding protein [Spraguea lophii 42_110]|uniref:GTP-binding protein n=1 Tax=Spraguea lophii (strain 42_110) TaxID=1358809 RepID=S7W7P2_SPRLO|nr:GTP-binding protein [Spraguea lophii 42_110]